MDSSLSLGDFARLQRQSRVPAAPLVIDNDNLSRVMDEVSSHRLGGSPLFSLTGSRTTFQASFPDGTCSLSFSANNSALFTIPYVAEDLPPMELAKLEGPATITDDTLEVSINNGTSWKVKEIVLGLTIVRRADDAPVHLSNAKLVPAAVESPSTAGKPSDLTLLFHLKETVVPMATTVFHEKLPAALRPGQEWHWAIVQAKGIRPSPLLAPLNY